MKIFILRGMPPLSLFCAYCVLALLTSCEKENNLTNEYAFFSLLLLFTSFALTVLYRKFRNRYKQKILQTQKSLAVIEKELEDKNIIENNWREMLLEKLTIAKHTAQFHALPFNGKQDFMKHYHHIFKQDLSENLNWEKLSMIINQLHDSFVEKLKDAQPTLTEKEIIFCSLLRADFQTEELGLILNYEYNSIRSTKLRIRKKLGFNSNEDFDKYIFNL